MLCEYCRKEIKGYHMHNWAYMDIMPKFHVENLDVPPNGPAVPYMYHPKRVKVCEECLSDMGIKLTK